MSKIKNQNLIKKRKLKIFWKIFLVAFIFFGSIYGLYFLTDLEAIQIKNVSISETKFLTKEFIRKVYDDSVSGRFFLVFAKNNFLFLPVIKIEENIRKELVIKDVKITKEGIDSVKIEIVENVPFAVYCVDDCYFVNDEGLFFATTTKDYDKSLIALEGEKTGEILGSYYISKEYFKNLYQKINFLKGININVTKIKTADFETFNLNTKEGPELFVEASDDPTVVVENLKAAIDQEAINHAQFKNLEYIDLRFEDRVFYKIK
jgi:cell division septal protein FtsQ